MNTLSSLLANLRKRTPVGSVQMFAGATAPTDWLLCDGTAVSRETFAALFNVIGTTYGDGDGSTTFNLPDFRGRLPIGVSTEYALNASGGSKYIQAHTHAFTQPSVTGGSTTTGEKGAHSHTFVRIATKKSSDSSAASTYSPQSSGGTTSNYSTSEVDAHTHSVPSHTHTVKNGAVGAVSGATTGNAGNMPPYRGINVIIYAGKSV